MKYLLIEIFLALCTPGIYFHDLKYTTLKSGYLVEIEYQVNDFLGVVLFLRTYIILRCFISFSRYYDARANRVSKMLGSKLSRLFAIRCIFIKNPYSFLLVLVFSFSLSLSYMIKIIEGPITDPTKPQGIPNNFNDYENCLWTIFITMYTGNIFH